MTRIMHIEFRNIYEYFNVIKVCVFLMYIVKLHLEITMNNEKFDFAHRKKYDVTCQETSDSVKRIPQWILNRHFYRQQCFIVCALPSKISPTSVGSSDSRVYENGTVRVATFIPFPNSLVDVERLAHHGFVYTGYSDRVMCYLCAESYCDWRGGENIRELHAESCRFRNIDEDRDNRQNRASNASDSNEHNQYTPELAPSSDEVSCNTLHQNNARHLPSVCESLVTYQNTLSLQMSSGHPLGNLECGVSQEHQNDQMIAQASNEILFQHGHDDLHQLLISSSRPIGLNSDSPFFCQTSAEETEIEILEILQESATELESKQDLGQLRRDQLSNTATPSATRSRFHRPNLTDVVTRIESFQMGGSSVFNLAANGFCFDISDNSIICFSCGFSLKNWTQHPDPSLEHETYGHHCRHLLEKKEDISHMSEMNYQVLKRLPSIHILLLMDYSWDIISVAIDDIISSENAVSVNQLHATDILEQIFHMEDKHRHYYEGFEEQYISDAYVQAIKEENQHLLDDFICKMCYDRRMSVVFLPCGHLFCCRDCSNNFRTCPMCRTQIQQSLEAKWVKFKGEK